MTVAEISFDLVMDDDMEFIEGTFRLPWLDWQVFVTLRSNVGEPEIKLVTWRSGVAGVNILCPQSYILNVDSVQSILGRHWQIDAWSVVQGPDSMALR